MKINDYITSFLAEFQKFYYVDFLPHISKTKNVECPCCGWKGKSFLRAGIVSHFFPFLPMIGIHSNLAKIRNNSRCPQCNSRERHRLYYLFLQKWLQKNKNKNMRLLHFAPEKIITNLFMRYKNIDYLSADLNPKYAMTAEDITNLSFKSDTFDFIFCSHVLEHINDDRKAMREIYRVLKTGGTAILQVPILRKKTYEDFTILSPKERERIFGQSDHVRIYGKDYINRLRDSGFKVIINNFTQTITPAKRKKYGLSLETLYICKK